MDAHEQLVAGSSALARGEWAAARDCFEAALSVEESAGALDGLALAVWWLNDPGTALELRARAFARLRHDGRDTEATAVAIWHVLAGKVTFKTSSGEETFETGDAYYVPAGHTPVLYAGTEVVEFSPTKELQQTLDVVTKNMEAAR